MVAIFTGAGAGLLRSSANILGGAGQLGGAAMGQGGESVSVNAATGNLVISRRDEFLVGRGPDAVIARTFNSLADTNDRDNLDGWHHSTTKRVFGLAGTLNTAGSTIKQLAADGSVITYAWGTRNGLAAYWSPDGKGTYDRLVASGADWVWTDGDSRFTETYSASAVTAGEYRITVERRDIDTNKLTFTYLAGTDKLDRVTTQNGEWLQYTWSGNDITQIATGNLDALGVVNETRTWYDYSGGRLIRVLTDLSPGDNTKPTTASAQSYWTEYRYDAAGRVDRITQTDGSQIDVTYDLSGRVSSITQKVDAINSRTTSLTYDANHTLVTAPDGKVTRLDFTSRNLAPTNMWEWSADSAYVLKDAAGSIAGEAAVRYTSAPGASSSPVSSPVVAVVAGDIITYTIDLMAVAGSATTQDLGIYGSISGWGSDVVTARIVSGPGSITTSGSALRRVSGLSTTEATRIEITRTFSQAENARVYLYVDRPGGYRDGEQLIAANGSLAKNGALDSAEQQLARITAPAPYSGAPLEVVDFTYTGTGDVLSVHRYGSGGTNPQDYGTTEYTYDDRGNVTLITDPTGRTVERFYDSSDRLLRERTVGMNASSSSAERWVRYAYDAEGHVAFVVDAEGRVTEHEYESAGDVTRTREYVDHSYTIGSTALTLAGMQAWRDGLGDLSTVQVTRYIYDLRKNLTAVRTYGLATTAGIESTADFEVFKNFTYDHRGNMLTRQDNGDLAATFVYDGMNRLVSSVDPKSATTSVSFTYGTVNTVVTTADGFTVTSTYNQAGELIASTDSGKWRGTSTSNTSDIATTSDYQYDEMGRLRVFIDARGKRTYYVYDDLGRNTGKVSEDGHLVEYQYDQAGRLVGTGSYYNAVSTGNRTSLGNPFNNLTIANIRPAAEATYDIWGWTVYDDAGRVVQTIGGTGTLTAYSYDSAGNRIAATTFATQVSVSAYRSAPPLTSVTPASVPADDITVRSFYDASGRLIGSLDGEGYLTAIVHDGAGQVVESIAYAGVTLESLRAGGTFAELKASAGESNPANRRVYSAYDGNGLLRFQVNGLGEVTSFEYDTNGLVKKATVHATTVSTSDYTYDNLLGLVTTSVNDRSTTTTFDTAGRVATVTTPAGLVTTYSYDTEGNVKKVQLGSGVDARIVRSYYSDGGQLRFTVDGEGYVNRFDYDPEGNNTLIRRFDTKITVTDSTTIDQVHGLAGGNFVDESMVYDNQGALQYSDNGEGQRSEVAIRANGYLYASYGGRNTSDEAIAFSYNDAAGRTTTSYAAWGETAAQLNGAEGEQTQTSYVYDAFGNTLSVTDPRSELTGYEYDERGLLTKVTNAENGVTQYEYNAFGELVKTTDAKGGITYTYYDVLGRAALVVDAEGYVTTTSYTSFGEIASVRRYKDPVTGASVTNRPTPTGASALTTFEYDTAGRLAKTTDARGFFETFGYNVFGERTSLTGKSETQVIADGSNNTTTYVYDRRGLLISQTLPIKSYNDTGTQIATTVTNTFEYDARGNRTKMTEASGLAEQRVTQYIYDKANRLKQTILPSFQGLTRNEYITYDARGNVTSVTDAAGGRTVFYYDDLGRKVVEISPVGTYTSYEYDKNGNVDRIRIFSTPVTVPLDGGSQEEAAAAPSGTARETIFAYDGLNRMTSSTVVLASGYRTGVWNGTAWTNISTTALTTLYQYDVLGNVVKTTDPEGNVTFAWYDDLSRKTAQLDAGGYLTSWVYDAEGNVTSERRHATQFTGTASIAAPPSVATSVDDRVTTYTYDDAGNRLTETRHDVKVHDAANAGHNLATDPDVSVSYLYNGLGQVVRRTEATLDQINYLYDDGGRLIEEKRDSYTSHQGTQVTPEVDYFYNGNGDLVRSVAAGAGDAAARITRYGHEGGVLKWMTDAEDVTRNYLYDSAGRVTHSDYLTRHDSSGVQTADAEGTLYLYDAAGRVTQQWQASLDGTTWSDEGPRTYFEYNAFGDVIATKTGTVSTAQVQNRYDLAGRLWATNSGDGVWKYFGYDKNGNQTIAVTSAGVNLSAIAGANSYFLLGSFTSTTAISQTGVNATYTVYDDRNLAIQVVEEQRELSAATPSSLTTSRNYNAFGEVANETDAALSTLTYTYNTMGRMIRSEGPIVSMTKEDGTSLWIKPSQDYYYDASGRLVAQRDANGTYAGTGTNSQTNPFVKHTVTNGTTSAGNLTRLELLRGTGYGGSEALISKQIAADNGEVETQFDIHGNARKVYDELDRLTTQTFDKLGRVIQVDFSGRPTLYKRYDELGREVRSWNSQQGDADYDYTDGDNAREVDYDALGRSIRTREVGGAVTLTTNTWDQTLEAAGTGHTNVGGWVQTISTEADRYSIYDNVNAIAIRTDAYGRAISRIDAAENTYTFTYDVAGRAISEIGSAGSRKAITWYNTGHVKSLILGDAAITNTTWKHKLAEYEYDKLDRQTVEKISVKSGTYKPAWTEDIIVRGEVVGQTEHPAEYSTHTYIQQDSEAEYDALGRMTRFIANTRDVYADEVDKSWTFDAVGNVRSIDTDYRKINANASYDTASSNQTFWYRYDSLNRLVLSKGTLSGTNIIAGSEGIALTYDTIGRRATAQKGSGATETYAYNAFDQVTTVTISSVTRVSTSYDALGRVNGHIEYDSSGAMVFERHSIGYSDRGQVLSEKSKRKVEASGGGFDWRYTHTVNHFTATAVGSDSYGAISSAASNGSSSGGVLHVTKTKNWLYDNASTPVYNSTEDTNAPDVAIRSSYDWNDPLGSGGPREIAKERNGSTSSETIFTDEGHIKAVDFDHYGSSGTYVGTNFINYETDMSGQITYRYEGGSGSATSGSVNERFYRFGGQAMGEIGNNGSDNVDYATLIARRADEGDGYFRGGDTTGSSHADFDINHVTMAAAQGGSSGGYTARGGESLQAVARSVWGDSSLWFRLAEANGLGMNTVLSAGQQITVPSGVVSNSHNASSFKPYDPANAIGDLTPGSVIPPAGQNKGCGIVGMILLAAIAIAATIVTAGAAIAALTPLGLSAGIGVVMGGGLVAKMGLVAGVAIGAGAAAVGSVVSQGVGLATGIQDKFSFKGVALAALGGGIGAGMNLNVMGAKVSGAFETIGNAAVNGVASSAATQGIARVTGLQSSFSWAGVAAAGVGAGVGSGLGGMMEGGGFAGAVGPMGTGLAVGGASLIASAATRSAIEGTSFGANIAAGLPDVIGQVLGRALMGVASGGGARPKVASNGRSESSDLGGPIRNNAAIQSAMDTLPNQIPSTEIEVNLAGEDLIAYYQQSGRITKEGAQAALEFRRSVIQNLAALANASVAPMQDVDSNGSSEDVWGRLYEGDRRPPVAALNNGYFIDLNTLNRERQSYIGEYGQGNGAYNEVAYDRAMEGYAYNERLIGEWNAIADREVNLLVGGTLAVGVGGGITLAIAVPTVAVGATYLAPAVTSAKTFAMANALRISTATNFVGETITGVQLATPVSISAGTGVAILNAAEGAGAEALVLRRAYLDAKFGRTGNLNNDINLRGYMSQVETLDVSSARGAAIFYSGPGNRSLAESFARTGGTTIEMTPGGAWLDSQALFKRLPPEMAIQPWERLSQRYAQSASGSVSTFTNGASTRGVFYRVELPALQANPNVTLILRNGSQPVRLSR